LHELATGRKVRVAVVDSAIDANHPDLAGQFQTRRNFVPDRANAAELHGTGVAGVIAALADNGVGVAGVAPGARLMALRACWQQETSATICNTLSLAEALHFAIEHDAQVINLSLSGPPDLLLGKLIDVALARGIVVVGAVDPSLAGGGFPASHPGVVAVSMSAAPGRDVPTTQPGGRWALVSGSSYSAAHVSGLAALLRERNPRARGPMMLVTAQAGGAIDACATLLRGAVTCGGCGCAPMKLAIPARAR
jgi:subtilisin family serine protease